MFSGTDNFAMTQSMFLGFLFSLLYFRCRYYFPTTTSAFQMSPKYKSRVDSSLCACAGRAGVAGDTAWRGLGGPLVFHSVIPDINQADGGRLKC